MITEEWREVPGYEGLRASSLGRIWLPESKTHRTKPRYGQWYENKGKAKYIIFIKRWGTLRVARLVCLAFHGKPPKDKPMCLHIDENSRNNKPGNLKWGDNTENMNAPGFLKRQAALGKARYAAWNGLKAP